MTSKEKGTSKEKEQQQSMTVAIGVDLGSTHCNIGIWHQGRPEILANHHGQRSTPTVVAFTDSERIVGEAAVAQQAKNRENTVEGFKWMVGLSGRDEAEVEPHVLAMLKEAPFTVSVDSRGGARVTVQHMGGSKTYSPEQLCSFLFEHLKEIAEAFGGAKVGKCVLSVPAKFDKSQREELQRAGKAAGMPFSVVLSDPITTCIAYGLDRLDEETAGSSRAANGEAASDDVPDTVRDIAVVDWGGGGIEATIVARSSGVLSISDSQANYALGGGLFTQKLMQFCAKDFKRKVGADVFDSKKAVIKLRAACEEAVKTLTVSPQADVYVEALMEGCDLRVRISRMRFEDLCNDIYEGAKATIKQALASLERPVGIVLMAGGIAQMPKVQTVIKSCFPADTPVGKGLFPDEAVVIGATVQASLIQDMSGALPADLPTTIPTCPVHLAVVPCPLDGSAEAATAAAGGDTEGAEERHAIVIPAGSLVPAQKHITLQLEAEPGRKALKLQVLQVEATKKTNGSSNGDATGNGSAQKGGVTVLGTLLLDPVPEGAMEVEVGFSLRSEGVLKVEAMELTTKAVQTLVIK